MCSWFYRQLSFSELEKLSAEEWIVFRKKIYHLDEFLLKWKTRLQNAENTPLTTRMMQEIHKYEVTQLYISLLDKNNQYF